ncbi:MAG TPA: MtnX-like HAD-IB family phosphatase [Dehalococcoidia bacterium]|nr:MtnX-like HAD-IB family phosphatase [Dehalococcoidia bacterium]
MQVVIIQCDFDGTIIENNLSILLRENFARGDWRKIESDYLSGRLTVEQSNKLQFALIKEPEEKLRKFVLQHVELRAGFVEFVRYCQEKGIQFVIVSSGLDFYIEPVLEDIGLLGLELYCGQASFTENGIEVTYRDPEGNIVTEGFKQKYLAWLKQRGGEIIYIGDGLSDLEAARQADHVFATGHLLNLLGRASVSCHGFSDFHDLLRQVRLLH